MEALLGKLVASVISGLVGGIVTGIAAWSAIKVELRYMRRDIDLAHKRYEELDKRVTKLMMGDSDG